MKRAFFIAVAAAGVLLAGCGSSGGHPAATAHPSTTAEPELPGRSTPSSPAAPSASVATKCTLGFDDDGTLLALTAANESHPRAEQVTFVNNSSDGVPIDGFETSLTSGGNVVTADRASAYAPNIPFFLIPDRTYTAVIDLSHLGVKITASNSAYLHSTCSVVSWD
jgi:hypothetical protein